MSLSIKALTARREALVARADLQRIELRLAAQQIEQRLAIVDRALAVVQRVKRAPLLAGSIAMIVALLALQPRRALQWISYAATAYSLTQRVRALLSGAKH
jgi:hypothetical protein